MSSDRFSFTDFFEDWTGRLQYFLDQLISSQNLDEDELKDLIAQVLGNYQQYYEAKAKEDVFSLFLPTWISTYELTFLWITGSKPGIAFNLVNNAVKDLSQVQLERIEKLKAETRVKEKELSNKLATIQESIAAQRLVNLSRELGKQLDGTTAKVNDVLEELRNQMQMVVQSADYLRMWTAREIVEILNLRQSVRFLGATTQFQIRLRVWGKQRDEQRRRNQGLCWKFLDF